MKRKKIVKIVWMVFSIFMILSMSFMFIAIAFMQ